MFFIFYICTINDLYVSYLKFNIMKQTGKFLILTLFLVAGFVSMPFNETFGQSKKEKTTEGKKTELVIGKKYDGKLSEATVKKIAEKMEQIKAEFEAVNVGKDPGYMDFKLIVDVNNLKSIDFLPKAGAAAPKDIPVTYEALPKLLKKYPYLDVMVTADAPNNKEEAERLATPMAMYLFEAGVDKSRLRVNGFHVPRRICVRISLVPSKAMIDKAVEGTL